MHRERAEPEGEIGELDGEWGGGRPQQQQQRCQRGRADRDDWAAPSREDTIRDGARGERAAEATSLEHEEAACDVGEGEVLAAGHTARAEGHHGRPY